MKKKILPYMLALITVILCFILPAAAASYNAPQDLYGLQAATITHYWGDSFIFSDTVVDQSQVVRTTAYSTGIDIADLIVAQSPGSNTKIRFSFIWSESQGMIFNELCLKGVPNDFKITISAYGISSMTGTSISTSLPYIDQQDGWYRYDNYSLSATMTPMLSKVTMLSITIDGGSAFLSTLADDDIILSISMLPYNLNAASDLQYNIGYQDAQKVYKDILEQKMQDSFNAGVEKGTSEGYKNAELTLVPEAYQDGKAEGYQIGKAEGLSIAENGDLRDLIFTIPEAHLVALEGFTNWNLFDYNLYDLLGGLTTLIIVAVLIKLGLKLLL